jgi:hypothetical protein
MHSTTDANGFAVAAKSKYISFIVQNEETKKSAGESLWITNNSLQEDNFPCRESEVLVHCLCLVTPLRFVFGRRAGFSSVRRCQRPPRIANFFVISVNNLKTAWSSVFTIVRQQPAPLVLVFWDRLP